MNSELRSLLQKFERLVAARPELAAFRFLFSNVRPSLRLTAQRVADSDIGLGDTRIGGNPDLPRDFEWPRWRIPEKWKERHGISGLENKPLPLGFIGQLDLSALPVIEETLPRSGWLYFFYDRYVEPWGSDADDRGSCRVVYSNCERSQLVRTRVPADGDPALVAHPCRIEVRTELNLPEGLPQEAWPSEGFPKIEYDSPERLAYGALYHELGQTADTIHHRFLGHPQVIQDIMEYECQLASNGIDTGTAPRDKETQAKVKALRARALDWRLLLQIDSDDAGPGWMWGDVGRIYYWIKKPDLNALRFDDVWLILQCH